MLYYIYFKSNLVNFNQIYRKIIITFIILNLFH
jgi:hypothetical protein